MSLRIPLPPGRTIGIDPDLVAIIAAATIDGDMLTLAGELDRKVYARVNKVISLAGGKWDRRRGAHVFADKPALAVIEPILVNGTLRLPPDLGWFPTPAPLAAELVGLSGAGRGSRVLEPSAGEGAIVRALMYVGAEVHAMEIDKGRHATLRAWMGGTLPNRCLCDDFLARTSEPIFDAVVMNPPFAPRSTDAHHVRHAFNFLRPGGRLVAVMSAGMTFRRDRCTDELRGLVHDLGGTTEPLPDGSFKASGTDVRTVVLTVTKPRRGGKA